MFRRLRLGEATQEARKQHKRSGSIYPQQQLSPPSFPAGTTTTIRRPTRHKLRMLRHQHHRRTEDVDYWRKRAGWFDDDETMKDYNDGVYDTYYQLDDDQRAKGGGAGRIANSDLAGHAIKALSVLVALCLCILIFRVIRRRLGDSKDKKKKRSTSVSRSKSRSRSRSRSRKGREGDYEIMDDTDGENKSHRSRSSRRSSRSKSRSRRSRSRSQGRARSRSKSRKEPSSITPVEPILV